VEVAVLEATGLTNGEESFDEPVAVVNAGAAGSFAHQYRETQRAFGSVVRWIHALDFGEVPECGPDAEQSVTEPAGLLITHPGSLFDQVQEPVVMLKHSGLIPADQSPVGLVGAVRGKDHPGCLLELTAKPCDTPFTFGERLEISEQMRLIPNSG
jgi:hypothetical protein